MKKLNVIILLIVCSTLLCGCIREKELPVENTKGITIGNLKLPDTLNVQNKVSGRDNDIICSLFDGLFELNEDSEVVCALAEKWSISDDGLEYEFKIKENAKWSNGCDITSDDFISFFKSILSPKSGVQDVEELYSIYGVKDYNLGRVPFDRHVSILKSDDKTFKIRLNYKDENLIYNLAKPKYRLRKIDKSLDNYKDDFEKIISSGAYKIANVNKENKSLELKKNEYYWEKGVLNSEDILVQQTSLEEFGLVSLMLDKLDILCDVPLTETKDLLEENKLVINPLNLTKVLEFNKECDLAKDDTPVRDAIKKSLIAECCDLDIVKNYKGEPTFGKFIREKEKGVIKVSLNKEENYDEKASKMKLEAKEIMKSCGNKFSNITLIGEDTSENKILCERFKKKLKEDIKININYELFGEEELKKAIKDGKYDCVLKDYNFNEKKSKDPSKIDSEADNNKGDLTIPIYFKNSLIVKSNNIEYLCFYGDGTLRLKGVIVKQQTDKEK